MYSQFKVPPNGKIENQYTVDVRVLKKAGALVPGKESTVSHKRRDGKSNPVLVRCNNDNTVTIDYKIGDEFMSREIELVWKAQANIGGSRPWFICPNCRSRVACIYPKVGNGGCRHCNNLSYRVEAREWHQRFAQQAEDIRNRLDWKIRKHAPAKPIRPKGMRKRMFAHLVEKLNAIENALLYADRKLLGTRLRQDTTAPVLPKYRPSHARRNQKPKLSEPKVQAHPGQRETVEQMTKRLKSADFYDPEDWGHTRRRR